MELSSKERILRIFRNEEVDRPALKLWGATPDEELLHPAYRPIHTLAMQTSDLFDMADSPFDILFDRQERRPFTEQVSDTAHPDWKEKRTTLHAPMGDLVMVERFSTVGEPGYVLEHFVKEAADLENILSMPWTPFPADLGAMHRKTARMGDRGIVVCGLDHAGYALHRLTGSETLALLSVDDRALVSESVRVFSSRIRTHARAMIDAGFRGVFGWVGPELWIPPLMAPRDFEEFVFPFDKTLCDDIHEAGGHVWVHCHGKVADFIGRYIDMGVDVLNPLEPPPNGDIHLSDTLSRFGRRIGLEGNIEIQDILQADPDTLRTRIEDCVREGARGGRFILCPSAGYMEYPFPTERYLSNLQLYLTHGLACCKAASHR